MLVSDRQTPTQSSFPEVGEGVEKRGSRRKISYVIGLVIVFVCVYSQYLGVKFGLVLGTLIVYGVPIVTITLLWGTALIRRFFNRTLSALKVGLGYFGAFTVLGVFAATIILVVLITLDPKVSNLLNKPNPALDVSSEMAWVMVGVSLLVVGPAEEYIFRGFVFGGLLDVFKNRHWLTLAFVSSLLFGVVHLYYFIVYGIASLIQFTDLATFGMAMAATYYFSGGNLFAPSLIHGVYDATAYVGRATSQDVGLVLRGLMIFIGIVFALILLVERMQRRERQKSSASEVRSSQLLTGVRG